MRIHLVFCPQFAGIGPPLGMASIGTVLRQAGHPTTYYDLETAMVAEHRDLYYRLYDLINVGLDPNVVHFVLRPELLLFTLYGDGSDPGIRGVDPEDWATAQRIADLARSHASWLLEDEPELVMISTYIGSLFFSMVVAQELKRLRPELPIVFGGPGCGPEPVARLLLETGLVQACVIGEGELTALELVDALQAGTPLGTIPGVASLDDDGFHYKPRRNLDMTTLVTPDFSGMPYPGANLRAYLVKFKRLFLPVSTARGCTLRCAFCSEAGMWRGFRRRTPEVIVAELEQQAAQWGITNFFFNDSLLNSDERWLRELCDAIVASDVDFQFDFAYMQARNLSTDTIGKLAAAGFQQIGFGVESGAPGVLDVMGKRTEVSEIKRIVSDIVHAGIYCTFGILLNFPGETREQIWETFDFVNSLDEELSPDNPDRIFCFSGSWTRVEPHSLMYIKPERFGVVIEPLQIRIPEAARFLEPALKHVLFSWHGDLDDEERRLRAAWQKRAIGSSLDGGAVNPLEAARPLPDDCLRFERQAGIRRDFDGPWRVGKEDREWVLSDPLAALLNTVASTNLSIRESLELHGAVSDDELADFLALLETLIDNEVLGFAMGPSMTDDPDTVRRHCQAGATASAAGRWTEAMALYERAANALKPEDNGLSHAVYEGLGLAAYGAEDYARAADALLQANSERALRYAISALHAAGRPEDAAHHTAIYDKAYAGASATP